MMFSVRIVNSDFYLADPIADLDVRNSTFREDAAVSKVPVIRVYGATPGGQKTCLHVHGIFPYIYVPYDGTQPTDKYLKQFATSVDFAVQVALGRASSSRQHVYEITVVKGIPYYGYHEGERDFLKIVLYNPFLVTRVVSLLQNGAIMKKVFQPHEAHIPYLLQFFMDYNLYGMNLLHVSTVKFRSPVRLLDGDAGIVTSSIQRSNSPQSTPTTFAASRAQIWNEDTVSKDWVLGSDVERLSFCELEVDVQASDILNKLEIGVNVGTNPGLVAIWEDEQQRRREANESSQISAPPTQERGFIEETETEKKLKERIREIIEERDVLIQSQMGKLGREALSPQELASFQDSISSLAASQKDVAGDISSDANALLQLLSQKDDDSAAESSQVVIDEDEPVVNESIVQEVVEASQRSFSQDLSSSLDKEMVDILTSLAEESSQPASQKTALSQSILLDQGDGALDEEANDDDDEDLSEADESIMMSQRVWDDIEPQLQETGDEEMTDVQENDIASQRVSQYDLEGMSDTWVGSFLGGDIPQLDGAADEDSDGKEDFKLPRGKRRKGNPRYQADKMSNKPALMLSATRGNSQLLPVNHEESGRNMERGKTEESGESFSMDVWPQTARAIRTYSKKGMSVLKSQRSLTLHEVDRTTTKDKEDVILGDTGKEVEEKKKPEDSEDEFRLFLSDSSDSEDNITKEANLRSKQNDVIGRQENDPSLKAIKRNSSSVRKDQGAPDESYTPVITKYFHSPEKNTERVRKHNEETPSSMDDPLGSGVTVGEHSPVQASSHCSEQRQGFSRKSTLRKRKLSEVGDKRERRRSKRTSLRRTRQNADSAASLKVVSVAMADVRVFIKDVSDTPALSSKFDEAQRRLGRRRENLRENFTQVNQRLSSPARKERLPGTSSPLQLRKNEKSPLSKKRRSPNRKGERMKKYGTLPVVIAKSPKKNFTADNVDRGTLFVMEEKRLPADSSSASRQCQDESSFHSSQVPRVFPVKLNSGTVRVSSRSRIRVSGLSSSRTIATATADGKKETSRSVKLPSRELALNSASSSSRGKSHSKKGHALSLQRKGLKRKLKLDTEKDVQPATVKVLPGVGKKRKLTLTPKEDKSRSDLGEESASETFASSAENRLTEEQKSTCEVQDEISSTQHVGFEIENNDSSLRSGNGKDFALNTSLSDDIICIPSSPGDSDCNDKSPNRAGSSASAAVWTSFPVSTKTSNKSEDESHASVSDEHRPLEKVNSLELVTHEFYFPEEKDTELLANALFNMSYPSPLPCLKECNSPPCPSSPLDTKRDTSDPRSQNNIVQRQKFFSVNSSIVEEDSKVSDDVKLEKIPASCLSQVHENALFSPADVRLRGKSLQLQLRPQLGETQSQFESTSSEYSDSNASKQLECESIENENGANSFDQIVADKETSCDKESFHVNRKNEDGTMEKSMIQRTKDSEFNLERAGLEEKSHGRKIESRESFAGLESRNSLRTEPLMQTSRTYLVEAEEQSSMGTVEKEFILELSTAEDSSPDSQPLERGDLQSREMEISVGEENQVQRSYSESMRDANFPVSLTIQEDHNKNQICSTHVMENEPNSCSLELKENDRLGQEKLIAIEPLKRPPTSQELLNSLKDFGLPQCRYQEPFCSDPDDIPACPREVGGRVLRIASKQVSNLPEFESSSSLQGLKHWRFVLSSARECSIRDIYQSIEDTANIDKNLQLKMALMGEGEVVITPCRGPPAYEAVKAWARDKLAKRGLQKQATEPALKKPELKQTTSNDGNFENVGENQLSEQRNAELVVTNTSKIELGKAMPVTSTPKVPPQEVTTLFKCSSVDAEFEPLLENRHKALDVVESEHNMDVMESSDSSGPVEERSPCSLFSPNEGKMFTFASGPPREIAQYKSVESTLAENQHLNTITGAQPMNIDKALLLSAQNDEQFSEPKDTLGPGTVTVAPSALYSPDGTPRQSASTTKQPLSPILESQSPVFAAPHHSTPVATKLVYGVQSPRCTPISDATKPKRLKTNAQTSGKNNLGNQASSDQTPSMRQRLLSSQFKFVTPGSEPRRLMPWSSQIEGPSPNNTYGFKVTQVNLKDAKALHEVQHLTLFSLELHVRTRREARPDPEFDPICAIFYYIQTDTSLASGKNKITGIICVDSESLKTCNSKTENKDRSISNTETTALLSSSSDAVASTSCTNNTSVSRTAQTSSTSHLRPLLSRSGVTDHEVEYVAEEKDLFPALIRIIRKWDPDILIGYEVQMFSWGFLLERALTFEIDLCTRLSRVKGSSSASNMDAEKDQWGAAHTSEIKIAGRIILNVWRLMRHEVTLNSYSFENVAFHVLHERIPLYTFRTLSDWWDHRNSLNRWRTVDHYVRRCRGNVRILESVDFIGRTSELARLFGILFFSVICRGSQYRVESMMLRIAKPMNYIAVSPSVEQRALMRAPEVIPLVMEPESRFYSDPVLVLDFQSLYPSMIIAYNYCFSTCLGRVSCLSEYGEFKFGATSLCVPPSLLKKLEGDIHVSPNGVAFVKSSVRRGILPSMLDEILQTRIMVKASMKKWKSDKSLGRMLDARQLGLKLIANVTYGYTSAHFSGRMPCVEIGDSIVRKARETLERAIDLVNNTPRWGARVVYGDTDSLFVLLKGATKEQAFNIGKDIVDTVTAMNPKPVKLKFEKVYLPCVLQTKKRYVGYMYETLDQKEPVFDAKGIETVRRDSCPAVAKVLEKSLRFLFETRDLSLIKKFVQRQCTKLMEGRASLQDFTFAKEYRGMKNYKPGACVPALELTRRMLREDRRSEPRVGERVPYVVVYGSPGLPLIQLVRRPHEVLQDSGLRLNASYYITKQILPPLNRVFSLIGLDVFTWYADLPRVVRVAQMSTEPGERKKGTISQYFSTMTCPVCQELTPTDLCSNCRARPQLSAVSLASRLRRYERSHQHLAEICYSCCGSRDTKLSCVSLDCPVFYKLVLCTRDLKSSQHLRRILESL